MHLQRNSNSNDESGDRRRSRAQPSHTAAWGPVLLWAALAASFPSTVEGQSTLDTQTCIAKLNDSDRNNNGVVSKVEFANFMVRASPYGSSCPDLTEIGDFLEGGKYYVALQTASCYCLQYDTDPNCCDEPSIRLAPPYPDAYLAQVCDDIAAALTDGCTPTASPTVAPTSSPIANIETRPTPTPTTVPTKAPSTDGTDENTLDLPKYAGGSKDGVFVEFVEFFERPMPKWMIIALPFIGLAMIVCCLGCCLLAVDCRRQRRKKQQQHQVASKGEMFESDDDSMSAYPEILEETDFDDTERSMEEGQITEQTRAAVAEKSSVTKQKSLPQPKSPKRMSQFLDSLDLESTADGNATADPRSADSVSRVNEFVAAVTDEKQSAKGMASQRSVPAKADSQGRMGKFFQNNAPSDASASSAEIFYDEQEDDASAGKGTTESNSQIKWKLLHPTTLVSTGAVEVFPLPPVVTGYVTSSSSSCSHFDSGESKEEEFEDEDEDDSVSDVYVIEDSDASSSVSTDYHIQQPDPDGVRLEDGRQYREQWLADR